MVTCPHLAPGATRPPRSRHRSLALAAATVWLPAFLPLLLGMLRDCSHCVHSYLLSLPIVPGVLLGALLQAEGGWFYLLAALPTLLLVGVCQAACRRLAPGPLYAVQILVMLLVTAQAIGFAMALRA